MQFTKQMKLSYRIEDLRECNQDYIFGHFYFPQISWGWEQNTSTHRVKLHSIKLSQMFSIFVTILMCNLDYQTNGVQLHIGRQLVQGYHQWDIFCHLITLCNDFELIILHQVVGFFIYCLFFILSHLSHSGDLLASIIVHHSWSINIFFSRTTKLIFNKFCMLGKKTIMKL